MIHALLTHSYIIIIFTPNREVMTRPSKRVAASRRGGKISAANKRQKTMTSQGGIEAEVLEESYGPSYGELTEEEDIIQQTSSNYSNLLYLQNRHHSLSATSKTGSYLQD